jgi:hypothetical protein
MEQGSMQEVIIALFQGKEQIKFNWVTKEK